MSAPRQSRLLPCDARPATGSVAQGLLAYARALHRLGAVQVGDAFTDSPEADAFIRSNPNAFLIGVLFTQGVSAERAWAGPHLLRRRLAHFDLKRMKSHPEAVFAAVAAPPALHRFVRTLPEWICAAADRLLRQYDGDAGRIWPDGSQVSIVEDRLRSFQGIGPKKTAMAIQLLHRNLGAVLHGLENASVAYDVHVRRVFMRAGLAAADDPGLIRAAAARAHPPEPGLLDLPAWTIGRRWCRPTDPQCDACPLGRACARLTDLDPPGVG